MGDKPTIGLEDARPGAGADGVGEESMLAPQEIYRPGEDRQKGRGEVLRKSGAAVSTEEMTREGEVEKEKKGKERGKKTKGNVAAQQVLHQLQSGDKPDGRVRRARARRNGISFPSSREVECKLLERKATWKIWARKPTRRATEGR